MTHPYHQTLAGTLTRKTKTNYTFETSPEARDRIGVATFTIVADSIMDALRIIARHYGVTPEELTLTENR